MSILVHGSPRRSTEVHGALVRGKGFNAGDFTDHAIAFIDRHGEGADHSIPEPFVSHPGMDEFEPPSPRFSPAQRPPKIFK